VVNTLGNIFKNLSLLEVFSYNHSMCSCFKRQHSIFNQNVHQGQDDSKTNAMMRTNVFGHSSPETYGGQIDQNSYFGQVSNEIHRVADKHFCHFLLAVANSTTMWVICGEEATSRSSIHHI